MKKVAIYGAGDWGKRAVSEIGIENVVCFIDNAPDKQDKVINVCGCNFMVYNLEDCLKKFSDIEILIAVMYFHDIAKDLEQKGLSYGVYLPKHNWYGNRDKLLDNPYDSRKMQLTEADAVVVRDETLIQWMMDVVKILYANKPLFDYIEIETYNRCNGGCEFCPVSVKNEKRLEQYMTDTLFEKIINELSAIDYDGCIALFSNNEPFLDKRMPKFLKKTRMTLPRAKIHLYTNGTKLSVDLFKATIGDLDELIIDNYNETLKLIPNNQAIYDYCKDKPDLCKKVTIKLRNPKEILEARGGEAPNKTKREVLGDVRCSLPFRQLIVRPSGKVSICCNDALGATDLGDLNENTLTEVWYGKKFETVREQILSRGRQAVTFCRFCDSMRMM